MTVIDVFASALGVLTLAASLLSQVALWQTKEYRWDRLRSHLRSFNGRLTNYPLALAGVAAILLSWLFFLAGFTVLADFTGFTALLAFAAHHVVRISRRGLVRPTCTSKAILIAAISVALTGLHLLLTFSPLELIALQWSTAIFFLPAFVGLGVAAGKVPFTILKKKIINRAKRLRAARTKLTVVGITGSFGKTSTKHFLEHIVKTAGQSVAATHAHHNTPIGVAKDMLTQLKAELEIYIAELGAYRLGEIKELTDIVQPHIGVITGIGNQHVDLFGSQVRILEAKWELVESLPPTGTLVINADDLLLMQKAAREQRPVIRYSTRKKADVWVEQIHFKPTAITCTLHLREYIQSVTLPLASEALLGSALAAAAAALAVGLSADKIAESLASLTPFPRTMAIEQGKNGAVVIDDSYSGNEQGTLLAIHHLSRFRQPDKRVVLFPLIELGEEAGEVHRKIGEAVRTAGAKLYVAGKAYRKQLGASVYESDPKKLAQLASANLSAESVVLLENRLPDVVRKAVLK